jgi:hypothetical protein
MALDDDYGCVDPPPWCKVCGLRIEGIVIRGTPLPCPQDLCDGEGIIMDSDMAEWRKGCPGCRACLEAE